MVLLEAAVFVVTLALVIPFLIVRGSEERSPDIGNRLRIASEASGEPLSGRRFLLLGVGLFACKYAADAWVASALFQIHWMPWDYFMPGVAFRQASYAFYGVLGSMAVPFLWLGVSLTLRRLRTLRRSPWLALLFLSRS